jgi:hypothetical protein
LQQLAQRRSEAEPQTLTSRRIEPISPSTSIGDLPMSIPQRLPRSWGE